jgi:cobalt/nickel transport system ATP-binding protein
MKVFELDEIHFEYRTGARALSGVSLSVEEGESISILGTNGSGKSTLLYILQGLIAPQSGSIKAFGSGLTESARARISVLFQNSQAQLFSLTVWDEILFGPIQMGLSLTEAQGRAEEVLKTLGISHLRDRSTWQLSGGEVKKVALATCLSTNPDVYLLDEPTGGLDPRSQVELIELIMKLRDAGKTIITATHDLHLVSEISERAVVLGEDHRVLAEGSPTRVLRDHDLLLRANLIHKHEHLHEGFSHEHSHFGPHEHHETPHAHDFIEEEHEHEHAHELGHTHESGQAHTHEHPEEGEEEKPESDTVKKIKILLSHWAEHNIEHAKTYLEWADKAEAAGEKELAQLLREIAKESEKMNGLFKKGLES